MSRTENKERRYKVMFNLKPNGTYTPRITIPDSLLRDINVRPGDTIRYERVENGILIRKDREETQHDHTRRIHTS